METLDNKNLLPQQKLALEIISNHATKNEIAAWIRKRKSIERLVEKIRPYEDQLLEIQTILTPMYDEIRQLRKELADACVHPIDVLVHKNDYIECKFCDSKLGVPHVEDIATETAE